VLILSFWQGWLSVSTSYSINSKWLSSDQLDSLLSSWLCDDLVHVLLLVHGSILWSWLIQCGFNYPAHSAPKILESWLSNTTAHRCTNIKILARVSQGPDVKGRASPLICCCPKNIMFVKPWLQGRISVELNIDALISAHFLYILGSFR